MSTLAITRMAITALTAIIVAAPGEATAKYREHVAQHRCACQQVRVVQLAAPQPTSLGAMRYFGGPKSPMWREVR
jgi:hypothetical protein